MRLAVWVSVVLLTVAASGCAESRPSERGNSAGQPLPNGGDVAPPGGCSHPYGYPDRPEFRGLTVSAAQAAAAHRALRVRVIGADGVCYPTTADLTDGRVNFYTSHGSVIWAEIF